MESICVKKGNRFKCFWLFSRKRMEGGGPKWAPVLWAAVRAGLRLGTRGPSAVLRWPPPPPALQPVQQCGRPRICTWEEERSPCPGWAVGRLWHLEKHRPGSCGQRQKASRQRVLGAAVGGWVGSLFPLSLGRQCQMGDRARGQGGQPGSENSLEP